MHATKKRKLRSVGQKRSGRYSWLYVYYQPKDYHFQQLIQPMESDAEHLMTGEIGSFTEISIHEHSNS